MMNSAFKSMGFDTAQGLAEHTFTAANFSSKFGI